MAMNCKKCGKEFTIQKGLVNYCSLECKNSRTWTDADKLKKSIAAKNNPSKSRKGYKVSKETILKVKKTWERKILESDFNLLKYNSKKRIILEQGDKCFDCGISEWLGQKITLELEHIDGNKFNNERQNLKVICPNCHSLTKTWRGRNCKYVSKIDEKEFLKLYNQDKNLHKIFIALKVSPKGGTYKTAYKILEKNNLLYQHF